MAGTADIFVGDFASQPLVFAHLWDVAGPDFNAERVEVIANQDPAPRLRHWFGETDARAIEDAMGMHTCCVIVFSGSGAELGEGTNKLASLGPFQPIRLRP